MVLGPIPWFVADPASLRAILLRVSGITFFLRETSVVSA
jgi:hypothetical protein